VNRSRGTFHGTLSMGAAAVFGFVGGAGCSQIDTSSPPQQESAALARSNGLPAINGLKAHNGLGTANGLKAHNGLTTSTGLSATTGLMTTGMGRRTVAYLAKCALGASQQLVKQDQYGNSYTFPGEIGLAPEWYGGSLSTTGEQMVSACMMAHVNTAGVHVPVWLVSGAPAIGWGQNPAYPNMEGTFFGDIMNVDSTTLVPAFYCEGNGFKKGMVPGRLGANQVGAPYRNPWGDGAMCDDHCTKYGTDGYTTCDGYANPITVWRAASYNPVFDDQYYYKLVNSATGLALDVYGARTAEGTMIDQYADSGSANQQFQIIQVATSQWKIVGVQSGKAINNRAGAGTGVLLNTYNGTDADNWVIDDHNGHFKIINKSNKTALQSTISTSGAAITTGIYAGTPNQDWDIYAVDSVN
jgi:Ricin-type beta-trefoil lectin domain-like